MQEMTNWLRYKIYSCTCCKILKKCPICFSHLPGKFLTTEESREDGRGGLPEGSGGNLSQKILKSSCSATPVVLRGKFLSKMLTKFECHFYAYLGKQVFDFILQFVHFFKSFLDQFHLSILCQVLLYTCKYHKNKLLICQYQIICQIGIFLIVIAYCS